MIIENQASVTDAVLEAFGRTADPRMREILLALVRHLHGFVREVRLTEPEFQEATRLIAAMGQRTTASHNEVVLMAGSLGVSALVCLLNNGDNGQTETQANLLGPFWREDQPVCASGDTLVRSATPGPALLVHVRVVDGDGRPVEGAEVDVWHSSPEGLYENQDPTQAEMNLRGRFRTDAAGRFHFRSVKPAGYPIPIDGPVGELVKATGRHNYRPAHLHFHDLQAGLQDADLADLRARRRAHRHRRAVRRHARAASATTCATTSRRPARLCGALVFARPALRPGARRGAPAEGADPLQGDGARVEARGASGRSSTVSSQHICPRSGIPLEALRSREAGAMASASISRKKRLPPLPPQNFWLKRPV